MSYFSEFFSYIMQNSWKWWLGDQNTRKKKFHFWVKYAAFIENENEFLKILIFGTHGLMTIFNKCSEFQKDFIKSLADLTS